MPALEREITLPSPPEKVWQVLVDFEAYGLWHPSQLIAGNIERFSPLILTSHSTPGVEDGKTTRGLLWRVEPLQQLEILSGNPAYFSALRYFHLTSASGNARLRHGVKLFGLMAWWRFSRGYKIERLVPPYEAFERALAQRLKRPLPSQRGPQNRSQRRTKRAAERKQK